MLKLKIDLNGLRCFIALLTEAVEMGSIGITLEFTVKVVTDKMWLKMGLKHSDHSVYHKCLRGGKAAQIINLNIR